MSVVLSAIAALVALLPKLTYIGECDITGYDPWCSHCCGKEVADAVTASGKVAEVDHTVAMCSDYPFGTRIYIEGMGQYVVEDRGVGKGKVDVACESHAECYKVTSRRAVYVIDD